MPRDLSQVILESVKLTTSIKHHNNELMSRTTRILSLIFQMRSLGLREIDSLAKRLREAVCLTVMVVCSDSKDPKLPPSDSQNANGQRAWIYHKKALAWTVGVERW